MSSRAKLCLLIAAAALALWYYETHKAAPPPPAPPPSAPTRPNKPPRKPVKPSKPQPPAQPDDGGGDCPSCPGPNCPIRPQPRPWGPQQSPVGRHEWRPVVGYPGEYGLWADGRKVGGWDSAGKVYRPYDAATDTWGPVSPCPVPAPAAACGAPTREQRRPAPSRPARGGKTSPDGKVEIATDLPESERKHNIASKGLGCCVFRSIDYAARWQDVEQLYDLPEQLVKAGIEGGGWPEKVDKMLAKFAPGVGYLQDTSGDIKVLEAILASGRVACVTWGGGHMLCCFACQDDWVCICDNNSPADDELQWMHYRQFEPQWKAGGGGWVVCLLAPPPPPVPHAIQRLAAAKPLPAGYKWKSVDEEDGSPSEWWALSYDGKQIGAWSEDTKEYRPKLDGKWGRATKCPVPTPDKTGDISKRKKKRKRKGDGPGPGVFATKIERGKHTVNGREVSREEMLRALQAEVPRDQDLLSLTVIGDEAQRQPVLDAVESDPALAPYRAALKVHGYDPDHWAVADTGFDTSGQPTVYVQDSAGNVLLHLRRFDGAEDLAGRLQRCCAEAIRTADPGYTGQSDPTGDPPPASSPGLAQLAGAHPLVLLALVAGGAFLFLSMGHAPAKKE